MNFFISIVVFAASAFLMVLAVRYGLFGMRRADSYFSYKSKKTYPGFQLYYRIPFSIGVVPEYFFAIVLGHDNYFRKDWWALKSASFISFLVFIAALKSRSLVYSYFTLDFILEYGITALFTSGVFIWYLNIVMLLFVTLFFMICFESIKMHGFYAPVRILAFSIMSVFMAYLTVMTLSMIIFLVVIYVAIKLIGFFFFSSKNKKKNDDDDDETATSILRGGLQVFKADLYAWEEDEHSNTSLNESREETTEPIKRRRPKITRRRKKVITEDEIPRLHPD